VEAAILNPQFIIDQLKEWEEKRRAEQTERGARIEEIRHDLTLLEQEEERVLAAYRRGATTLRQFEKEIAKVNARRPALEELLEKAEQAAPETPPPEVAARDIDDWSRVIRKRLHSFNEGKRQQFLGCLLNEIIINGDAIRIRGEIPARTDASSQVVPTTSYERGHNMAYPFEFVADLLHQGTGYPRVNGRAAIPRGDAVID
jgi:hypothetical protein